MLAQDSRTRGRSHSAEPLGGAAVLAAGNRKHGATTAEALPAIQEDTVTTAGALPAIAAGGVTAANGFPVGGDRTGEVANGSSAGVGRTCGVARDLSAGADRSCVRCVGRLAGRCPSIGGRATHRDARVAVVAARLGFVRLALVGGLPLRAGLGRRLEHAEQRYDPGEAPGA